MIVRLHLTWKMWIGNMLMYLFAVGMMVLAVQHSMFFYSWPPDKTRWVDVPVEIYPIAGALVFIMLKCMNALEQMSELIRQKRNGHDVVLVFDMKRTWKSIRASEHNVLYICDRCYTVFSSDEDSPGPGEDERCPVCDTGRVVAYL